MPYSLATIHPLQTTADGWTDGRQP